MGVVPMGVLIEFRLEARILIVLEKGRFLWLLGWESGGCDQIGGFRSVSPGAKVVTSNSIPSL